MLRKRRLPNRDNIITLFTLEHGKINALAKGIKKITSRRSPHLQTGNLIQVMIATKDGRFYLQESSLVSAFSKIKGNEEKTNQIYTIFFVLDRLLPENQNEEPIYFATKKFLVGLSKGEKTSLKTLVDFLNKILKLLGYSHAVKDYDELLFFISDLINEKMPTFTI